ncbi:MAG: M1 family aminopeptidase, partial [Pyrinomonadaceae bacterium]
LCANSALTLRLCGESYLSTNSSHAAHSRAQAIIFILYLLSLSIALSSTAPAQQPVEIKPQQESAASMRPRYQIKLNLDFDNRTYTGNERVRWINRDNHSSSVLYFHLYSNMRSGGANSDEPRIDITEVRSVATNEPLFFSLEDQATTLRVNLREAVGTGEAAEVLIGFKGSVPEIDSEETGLFAHIVQQVGAALRSEREVRRARDVNFLCRGMMLLGTAYPVLATRDGDDWQRKVEQSIGDMVFAESSHYRVEVEAAPELKIFASGASVETPAAAATQNRLNATHIFAGENLRDFAIVAGKNLRVVERMVGDVNVRSIYLAEHEAIGKRVLAAAADAVRVYSARFGPLPNKTVSIVDAPLVAGLGSTEFAGLGAIASAFYVDFDSPSMRNLPEMIREQRTSVEDSLEWAVAHMVAHQWWGTVVGNDPSRDPVLDEALANWSALLYYREVHGEERAQTALEDQLRGVYKVYRTFGGEDMSADHSAREYRNFFQYAAIVSSKGALMFDAVRQLIGDEKFFAALQSYYNANKFEVAELDDLRGAFIAETPVEQRRTLTRTFNRWLSNKRGDEDIAPPDPKLAAALGVNPNPPKSGDRNAFARLGKFFWQQMTRIR